MEEKRIKLYQGMKSDGLTKTYKQFITTYFSNSQGVDKLYNALIDGGDFDKSLKVFYEKFCCDLSWAKNGDYCKVASTGGSTGGGSSVSQGWLPDPTGNKTWEYQLRDCKWIARKIGKTTEYPISDNPKYASSVQKLNDDNPTLIKNCNKPSQTQPVTPNVVTGGGQQQGQSGSNTPTGGQSGVNQSQGLGVPNSIDLGLDEIDKLVNPVKPETVTQTSTPTTQQESIKDNVNILKEEFYSTLKKIS